MAKVKIETKTKPTKKPRPAIQKNPAESDRVLVLRTCNADMSSSHGFVWPKSGRAEAPDWDGGKKECGGKLHGFLWGEGDGSLACWAPDAKWLVVSVPASDLVELSGKVGFRSGEVVFCGDRLEATSYIAANGGHGRAIIGGTATAGDSGTATAGHSGTATAGDSGTATAGYSGTATAGHSGTATAGHSGTATAGHRGTATAGDSGIVTVRWYCGKTDRYRLAIGYPGENGIKANTAYRADAVGNLVEVEKS